MRCRFMREWQVLCSSLKVMSFEEVAGANRTGMLTMPKLTMPFQIDFAIAFLQIRCIMRKRLQ